MHVSGRWSRHSQPVRTGCRWPFRSYELALGRAPTDHERQIAAAFIETQAAGRTDRGSTSTDRVRRLALTDYCQALFGLNEFLYVE
jgi:hypothetical protein